jgi:hypothetical protein
VERREDFTVRLARAEAELKTLSSAAITHLSDINRKFDAAYLRMTTLDNRLRTLEIRVATFAGVAALVGTLLGAILARAINL